MPRRLLQLGDILGRQPIEPALGPAAISAPRQADGPSIRPGGKAMVSGMAILRLVLSDQWQRAPHSGTEGAAEPRRNRDIERATGWIAPPLARILGLSPVMETPMSELRPVASPLLDHCPESLPSEAYLDDAWFARERERIWAREWIYAGRLSDMAENTLRRIEIAGQPVLLARGSGGHVAAFLNVCRHRGAELCPAEGRAFNGRLITCPYHAWAYDMEGALRSTAFATPTADFDHAEHGLFPVTHRVWRGCVFLTLAKDPEPLQGDPGLGLVDNWSVDRLVTGHVHETELACNWKIFWENYNECLHCPGIHPGLSGRVPVYAHGIMSAEETGGDPFEGPVLAEGAESWTVNGRPCGPLFPGLTPEERAAGHSFVTIYPSAFIVAHVDYVRITSLNPLAPGRTVLRAEWLFAPETLAAPGFDLANAVDFARQVIAEDGAACEMNQRGLAVARHRSGRLMPQEFEIKRFHDWVRARMAG